VWIHVWITLSIYGEPMSLSWSTAPPAIRVGGIAAIAGFFASITTTSSRSVNGRLTECSYTDYGALIIGAVAILAGVVGFFAALSRKEEDRTVVLGVSIGIALVGVLHIMRGIGAVGGPCH
jgi:predicted membrane channel-forming protein YqfA (hemolysin III family)